MHILQLNNILQTTSEKSNKPYVNIQNRYSTHTRVYQTMGQFCEGLKKPKPKRTGHELVHRRFYIFTATFVHKKFTNFFLSLKKMIQKSY